MWRPRRHIYFTANPDKDYISFSATTTAMLMFLPFLYVYLRQSCFKLTTLILDYRPQQASAFTVFPRHSTRRCERALTSNTGIRKVDRDIHIIRGVSSHSVSAVHLSINQEVKRRVLTYKRYPPFPRTTTCTLSGGGKKPSPGGG